MLGLQDSEKLRGVGGLMGELEEIDRLKALVGWGATAISSLDISKNMLRSKGRLSLDKLAQNETIKLIKATKESGIKVAEIHVYSIGIREIYQRELDLQFPDIPVKIWGKNGRVCAVMNAATIYAKVISLKALKACILEYSPDATEEEFPSGYPSDPKSGAWIKEYADKVFGLPNAVRFSWEPWKKIEELACVAPMATVVWPKDVQTPRTINNNGRSKLFTMSSLELVTEF